MKNRVFLLCLTVLVLSGISSATIRRVGLNQTYTTLTAAYTAAANDDTLLISPGAYSENITSTKRLTWLGAGYDEVSINGKLVLNTGSSGTTVEGLQYITAVDADGVVQIGAGVDLVNLQRCWVVNTTTGGGTMAAAAVKRTTTPGGNLTIRNCILETYHNYTHPTLLLAGDNATVSSTVFQHRGPFIGGYESYAVAGTPSALTLSQCAFFNYRILLNLPTSFPLYVMNCVVHDWWGSASWGTYPGGGTGWSYNASTTLTPPGSNALLLDGDPFESYDENANFIYGSSDLHLSAGSPCIDAGDPAILDLDNSSSDMGIYGGQTPHVDGGAPNYPFAIDLTIPSNMSAGQQLPIQATGRIGAGY